MLKGVWRVGLAVVLIVGALWATVLSGLGSGLTLISLPGFPELGVTITVATPYIISRMRMPPDLKQVTTAATMAEFSRELIF